MPRRSKGNDDGGTALARRIIFRTAVQLGIVDPNGKTDAEIEEEVRRWVEGLSDEQIGFVIDHRPTLLEEARRFWKDGNFSLSCVMYATWTEHWLNGMIYLRAHKHRMADDDIKEIIRSVQMVGKMSWLWRLLSLAPFPRVHVERIRAICEARNAFVHYKWNSQSEALDNSSRERLRSVVEEYAKTVKYLQRRESEDAMKKSTRRLQRLARAHARRAGQQGAAADEASPRR